MIADLPKPFLFIHIPKTAGTSVETALIRAVCGKTGMFDLSPEEATRHALYGGVREVEGHPHRVKSHAVQHESVEYFETLKRLDGRHVFSVVRNPYERALSEIVFLLCNVPRAKEVFRGPSWAADLKAYARYEGLMEHDLSACQVDWLTDREGKMRCDRVLRFETLDEDWRTLCGELGLEGVKLPYLNSMERQLPWWEYYDEEAAEGIARKYARDFEIFGYEVNLPFKDAVKAMEREAWIGVGQPPRQALCLPAATRHGRLELPDGSVGRLHVNGHLETISPEDARRLLKECHRILAQNGELVVHTLDLEFVSGLMSKGYDAGTREAEFLIRYVDEFLPEAGIYAPAFVCNDLLRRKGQVFMYDWPLLAEFLEQAGFVCGRMIDGPVGEIVATASKEEMKGCRRTCVMPGSATTQ